MNTTDISDNSVKIIRLSGEYADIPPRYRDAVFFKIVNGLGRLTHNIGRMNDDCEYDSQLLLNGKPIMQGRYPACPTCYGMLATGYGIENIDCAELKAIRRTLNQEYKGVEEAFYSLQPVLRLLDDGHYMLADVELAPTDGKHFFYNVSNKLTKNPAVCDEFYDRELFTTTNSFPAFMYPTQSARALDMRQVETYIGKLRLGSSVRGLAYHEHGFICALLDGHHKAVAAAQLGVKLKCLVIIPASGYRKVESIDFCGATLPVGGCVRYSELISMENPNDTIKLSCYSLTDESFTHMDAATVKRYHTVESLCMLEAAEIDDSKVTDEVIADWISRADSRLVRIMLYRRVSDFNSAYDIAEKIIRKDMSVLPNIEAWETVFMRRDEHTEQLAIDYLVVHDKDDRCWDIVNSYWD